MSVAPARECAFGVLRRVFEHGAYADRALQGAVAGLDARDRALATRLVFGTVQRAGTLDHVIARLARREAATLDAPLLAALRLGLYQLLYLDGIADHAAVNDSVALAKRAGGRGFGLVNAVLRRATREGAELIAELHDDTPQAAATAHSVPPWIAALWWESLGAAAARALLETVNTAAESALRANTLVTDAPALASALPVAASIPGDPPEAVLALQPLDIQATRLWRAGACMPQSRSSMLIAHALAPRPGERVLDLCAAPGAKTTHIAALMQARGQLLAVERHAGRAAALARTCERMKAGNVEVLQADALQPPAGQFDRVLLDPPCSGLGTLRSRPDLRWRVGPDDVAALAREQSALLSAAATKVTPGGTLVYSTCTISPDENERQIDAFLQRHRDFAADDLQAAFPDWAHPGASRHLLALPHVQGSDGFFVARLRRVGAAADRG